MTPSLPFLHAQREPLYSVLKQLTALFELSYNKSKEAWYWMNTQSVVEHESVEESPALCESCKEADASSQGFVALCPDCEREWIRHHMFLHFS